MRITYLFDVLCGWCYGAGPALDALAERDDVTLELAPTGLFADAGARTLDAGFAAFAWQNDQRIARLTGQVFSNRYRDHVLGAVGQTFDSAAPTLGLVAVGLTEPLREREALKILQIARYADGRNTCDPAVVSGLLASAGFAAAARLAVSPDKALLAAYRSRIESARADMESFGARGVPALLVGTGDKRHILPSDTLFSGIDGLMAKLRAA